MLAFFLTACLTNPATGRLQLNLIGQGTEVELGQQLAAETTATMPLLEDEELTAYVSEITLKLAALSERPTLPWQIQVLDDPTVNAFALPGGYLYITRGLMAWLGSEDELAAVIGHEIGHVTARHSANTLSRTILAAPLLGLVGALDPQMEHIGALTGLGTGLARLSHSREDERQADDLGLRYLQRAGYDPSAMLDVFTVLETVEKGEGDRLPTWLLTHPTPTDRRSRLGSIAADGARATSSYLRRIDGMVFGADPRQGFFESDTFHHPVLSFRIELPAGWTHLNQHTAVSSISEGGNATFELTLAEVDSPQAALDAFFAEEAITARDDDASAGQPFQIQLAGSDGTIQSIDGTIAVIAHGGAHYQLLGAASSEAWPEVRAAISAAIDSFTTETDPAVLERQPQRLRVGELAEATALPDFAARYPAATTQVLGALNRQEQTLPAGLVRWVE